MTNLSTGPKPLRSAAFRSAISLGLGFGYSQIIRLISVIVLYKLLFPEAFGLMSLAYTVLLGLQLFSDLGIRTSVVQNARGDDPRFLNTAWTLQILRGFILWFVACLLAWPAAYWRPEPAPDLLWLLPLIGFTAVFDGFTSTKLFTLSRHISQGREVRIEMVGQTLGVGTTIIWAYLDKSVLALAAGQLLASFVKMLMSHLFLPGLKNQLCWDRTALKDLAHFAKWIYLGTMFTFVAQYADRLVVGLGSIEFLGVYSFARQLADAPPELMLALGGKLIFPIYSRMVRSETDLHSAFPRVHLMATCISALLLAGILATGPSLIHCMVDRRYWAAAWILPFLAAGSWFRMLESNAGTVFFAKGLVRYSAYSNAAKAGSLLLLMPLGFYFEELRVLVLGLFTGDGAHFAVPNRDNQLRGLILGFVAGDVVRYAFTVRFLRRERFFVLRNDLSWTAFVVLSAFLAWTVGNQVWSIPAESTSRLIYLPRLLVQGSLVVLFWSVVALACRRKGYFRKPQPVDLAT